VTERSVGINTTNATDYVAAFIASEQADGHSRQIQIIAFTGGKIDSTVGSQTRSVTSNDSDNLEYISDTVAVGDDCYLGCYIKHSEPSGSCVVTPLLCDAGGGVIGVLEPKKSVAIPVASGSHYLSTCLTWQIMGTGAWRVYPHINKLSESNSVDVWLYSY